MCLYVLFTLGLGLSMVLSPEFSLVRLIMAHTLCYLFSGSMQVVGVLKYGLAKVADLIVRSVITPAINDGCRILWTDNLNDKSGRMTDAILKTVPSSDPKVDLYSD